MVIVKHLKSSTTLPRFKKTFSFRMIIQMDIGINRNFRISNISINKQGKKRYKNYLTIMYRAIFIKRIQTQLKLENLKGRTHKTKCTLRTNSNKQHTNILFINNMAVTSKNHMHMDKSQINNKQFMRLQSKFLLSKVNLKIQANINSFSLQEITQSWSLKCFQVTLTLTKILISIANIVLTLISIIKTNLIK